MASKINFSSTTPGQGWRKWEANLWKNRVWCRQVMRGSWSSLGCFLIVLYSMSLPMKSNYLVSNSDEWFPCNLNPLSSKDQKYLMSVCPLLMRKGLRVPLMMTYDGTTVTIIWYTNHPKGLRIARSSDGSDASLKLTLSGLSRKYTCHNVALPPAHVQPARKQVHAPQY
jgi:hypothetical protein